MTILVLTIPERIEPVERDHEAHKAWCIDNERCIQRGCRNGPADDSDLCTPHRDAHRASNAQHMQFKRKQLGLPFVHIDSR